MKSKISKVAEFWGAETPFSKLGREDARNMENGGNAVSQICVKHYSFVTKSNFIRYWN
jgi:hypothetical protein